jgi:hypothetical protein
MFIISGFRTFEDQKGFKSINSSRKNNNQEKIPIVTIGLNWTFSEECISSRSNMLIDGSREHEIKLNVRERRKKFQESISNTYNLFSQGSISSLVIVFK